jgi:hypothetical protein
MSILFEDHPLLKAQLFFVASDKVLNPKSVNIDVFYAEEITPETGAGALSYWRLKQNCTTTASQSSDNSRGRPGADHLG